MEPPDQTPEIIQLRRLVDAHYLGEADQAAQHILQRDPEHIQAMLERITLWFTWGALEPVTEAIERIHQLAPGSPADLFAQAVGDPDRSPGEQIRLLRQAVTLAPEFERAWFALGKIEWDQKQYEQAASDLDRALALAPQHASALLYAGRAKTKVGDYLNAANHLCDYIKTPRFPDRFDVFLNLAYLFSQLAVQEWQVIQDRQARRSNEPGDPEW